MIVNVQLRKSGANEYGGREYSYRCGLNVSVGDVMICPTASGLNYGKITRVNVPESEIDARWRDKLREIVDFAPQPVETKDEIEDLFA